MSISEQRTAAQIAQDKNKAKDGTFQSVTHAEAAGVDLASPNTAMDDMNAITDGLRTLDGIASSAQVTAAETYVRALADLVKKNYPNAARLHIVREYDSVDGESVSEMFMVDAEGLTVAGDREFFGHEHLAGVGEIDAGCLNNFLTYDDTTEELDEDNRFYLDISRHEPATPESRTHAIKRYQQQIDEMTTQLDAQRAQVSAVLAAQKVDEWVPGAHTIMIDMGRSGEYVVAQIGVGEKTFTNPSAAGYIGTASDIPWHRVGRVDPDTNYPSLSGRDLSMEELRNWAPGQELTKS